VHRDHRGGGPTRGAQGGPLQVRLPLRFPDRGLTRRLDRPQRRLPHRGRPPRRCVRGRRRRRDARPHQPGRHETRRPGQPRASRPPPGPARRPPRARPRRRGRHRGPGPTRPGRDARTPPHPLRGRKGLHHRRRLQPDRGGRRHRQVPGRRHPPHRRGHHLGARPAGRPGQPGGRHHGQARREAARRPDHTSGRRGGSRL
ncbi:MAG: Riboflavin synthase eubacterial/eukaryotic, partial [uncultured Acidimicrobiales bacterium]